MITLVTDSTAYLTKEEADRLKLRVVPMHYTIAGNSYTEGFADENQNFVDKIAANPDLCATAQASVADFVGMFQAIVHQGGEVLCVVISSRLSGAYSSACIAAKAVDAEKVRVVDSRTTAGGLALLLKKAAKLIRQGYPLEDIVAQVKKQREKTGIAFSVEDMESLRKSGRLSIVRQSVGAILNIRPILCLEKDGGALVCAGTARGRNAQMQALADRVPIIRKETQSFLKVLLQIERPGSILELGTAVGFSALLMSAYAPEGCRITTIENYEKRIPIARENFRRAGKEKDITLLEGDALEVMRGLEGPFDLIFMDAAKAQYIHYLPEALRLLEEGGVLVTDNVLQDGDIMESRFAVERRNRTIHKRMREYLYQLKHDERLLTSILPLGDGLAVSVKKGKTL